MNIVDYIPVGHQNAVTRKKLCILTGLSDRKVRDLIADARRETPIINQQDSKGYYIPDTGNIIDMCALRRYVKQEEHRLKSIGWSLKAARRAAGDE